MKAIIESRLAETLKALVEADRLPEAVLDADIRIDATKDKAHGDFATNLAMLLAKPARSKPRDIAELIVASLPDDWEAEKVEIAGPGFINFWASDASLAERANALAVDPRLGVPEADVSQTVVVDYSAPNVAKQMHVGHLRSTIIGDAIVRTLEFLGHRVIRQNHVGDWGTQFGMLLAYFEEQADAEDPALALNDLEAFYQAAKKRFDEDTEFAERSRQLVVSLQSGDDDCMALWTRFNDISLSHCQAVYDRLGVKLTRDDVYGESKYNDDLGNVVASLEESGLLTVSDGARVVFQSEFRNKNGEDLPLIVEKAGGGYLYATTDLAAVRHRVNTLKADRVLYVVDQRQALHFEQVFSVARKAGFLPESKSFEHLGFGTMNGEDGRPFRTRAGGTIKLSDLLDEAIERAHAVVKSKNPDMDDDTLNTIAESVAISAVKYADLSKHRTTDYIFSFDQMLSLVGNTAPYMLYAYARIASIFRSADLDPAKAVWPISLDEEKEQELVVKLLEFEEVVNAVAARGLPHLMCTYLYQLATVYSSFYEHCPVLAAQDEATRQSRLTLSAVTQRTLSHGLSLLGINTLERM